MPVAATTNPLSKPSSLHFFSSYKASICAPLGSYSGITLPNSSLLSSAFSKVLKILGLFHTDE